MPRKYRVRPLLDRSYYIAIGRAVATWAILEIKFDEHMVLMLRHDKANRIKKRHKISRIDHIPKALKVRMDLSDELAAAHYSGEPLQTFRNLTKRCRTLAKDRNRLAHGEWIIRFMRKGPPKLVSRMRFHSLPVKERTFTVPQIRRVTQEFCELFIALDQFMYRHHPHGPLSEQLRKLFGNQRHKQKPSGRPATQAARP